MSRFVLAFWVATEIVMLAVPWSASLRADELPPFGKQVILDAGLDQQAAAEIASQLPAADFQAVLTKWSEARQAAISDDARMILVIQALIGERVVQQNATSTQDITHQAATRGLDIFVGEFIEEAKVVPMAALIKRELGDYTAPPKEANRLGIFDLPAGVVAGEITTADGQSVMKLANESKVVLPLGRYSVQVNTKTKSCEGSIELKGGNAGPLVCS